MKTGSIYIVSTPIGNLKDITIRAIEVLQKVDVIACEDTRVTKKLLKHYNINKPLLSYHEHNEKQRCSELINYILQGKDIGLISDAGTPLISDPGFVLIRKAVEIGAKVIPVPGPSSILAGLVASGLPTDKFTFVGFLPRKKGRKSRLNELKKISEITNMTFVFLESPHRIERLITELIGLWGEETKISICRELTKLHEQIITANAQDIFAMIQKKQIPLKGEFVVIAFVKKKS